MNMTHEHKEAEETAASAEPVNAAEAPIALVADSEASSGEAPVLEDAQDVYSDQPVHATPAPTDITLLKPILEAILMAAGRPMTVDHLHDLFGETQSPGKDKILEALSSLMADCAGRGVELIEVASGFRYQVGSETQIWVSRLWTERQTKYSRALLETLALIAYRQPITRAEIEAIRGVAVSSYIIKTLEEREWIRVLGHRDVPGRPALFGTTRQFLDYFSLKSLDQLPPLAELRDFEALEPQMPLAGTTLDEVAVDDGATGSAEPVIDDVDTDDESNDAETAGIAIDEPQDNEPEVPTDLVADDDVDSPNEDPLAAAEDIERADLVDTNVNTGTTP